MGNLCGSNKISKNINELNMEHMINEINYFNLNYKHSNVIDSKESPFFYSIKLQGLNNSLCRFFSKKFRNR